jgi:hypothetical protein
VFTDSPEDQATIRLVRHAAGKNRWLCKAIRIILTAPTTSRDTFSTRYLLPKGMELAKASTP